MPNSDSPIHFLIKRPKLDEKVKVRGYPRGDILKAISLDGGNLGYSQGWGTSTVGCIWEGIDSIESDYT
jgi:hypothetical protein